MNNFGIGVSGSCVHSSSDYSDGDDNGRSSGGGEQKKGHSYARQRAGKTGLKRERARKSSRERERAAESVAEGGEERSGKQKVTESDGKQRKAV